MSYMINLRRYLMIDQKLSGMLGMAVRARKVSFGESAFEGLSNASGSLLIISDDASERTLKKLVNRAEHYNVDYVVVDDFLLNQATGNTTRKYCLINDRGFSKGILDICRKR